jgi:hypothetical protein
LRECFKRRFERNWPQGILLVLLLAAAAFGVFRTMNAATRHGLENADARILVVLPMRTFVSPPSL